MIGVEAVDCLLFGAPEMTLNEPDWVNGRKVSRASADSWLMKYKDDI